ncbi:MAG: FN3 domain-containing metallophosphoesterase family protein [Coprobacillus sp.]
MKQKQTILKVSMATMAIITGATSISTLTNTTPIYADSTKTTTSTQLITGSTNWKYLDTNTDPGTSNDRYAWTKQSFSDIDWKSAAGKFGHKKGELADLGSNNSHVPTVLLNAYTNDEKNIVIPAYFFRTTFNIQTLDDMNTLTGSLDYDDAAIIYINGTKMVSFDEPAGGYTSNMSYGGSNASTPKTGEISISKDKLKDVLKVGSNTISVEIHQAKATSSDVYFDFKDLQLNYGETPVEQKALNLTVGKDESEMNVTWYANSSAGEIQFAKASTMQNGEFPNKYTKVTAKSNLSNDATFNYHQATMSNLDENTKYVYRLVNENTVSELHYFTTKDFDESFNFIFAGDPQIGTSGTESNAIAWGKTLESSVNKFNPNFILSGGDQVNTASSESEYNGYLNQEELTSVPQSPSIGNHDTESTSYSQHFNLPNVSNKGATTAGSDYYYVYNNTLFLNINTNNTSTAEHKQFIKDAIEANQDVRWKVVTFHHSIYSVASHAIETNIINRRNNLVPIFDEFGIDVVLMGHDHVYVRSHIMKDLQVTQNTSELSSVTDPNGILYVTANSASGSKYYDIQNNINMDFVAKKDQSKQRSISNITVSDNEFKVTTYLYNSDTNEMSTLDEFSIKKSTKTNETDTTLTPKGDSSISSTIIAPKGTIEEGSEFTVKEVTTGTTFNQIKEMISNKGFKLLDLSLMKDSVQVNPLGEIQVQFELPEGYSVDDLLIYKIANTSTRARSVAQMQLDNVEFKIVDGKVIVTTDMLGQFVLVNNKADTPDVDQTPDTDQTPDSDQTNKTPESAVTSPKDVSKDSTQKDIIKTNDNSDILSYSLLTLTALSSVYVVVRKKKIEE